MLGNPRDRCFPILWNSSFPCIFWEQKMSGSPLLYWCHRHLIHGDLTQSVPWKEEKEGPEQKNKISRMEKKKKKATNNNLGLCFQNFITQYPFFAISSSSQFFFLTSLRYNWHTIDCLYLKYTIWWVLTWIYTYELITTIEMLNVLIAPKGFLVQRCNLSLPPFSDLCQIERSAFNYYRFICTFWNFMQIESLCMYILFVWLH